jgi:hypothetical protein
MENDPLDRELLTCLIHFDCNRDSNQFLKKIMYRRLFVGSFGRAYRTRCTVARKL